MIVAEAVVSRQFPVVSLIPMDPFAETGRGTKAPNSLY
jgi:hypothetical protein